MSSGDIVKLNVGGTVFQTTESTLIKFSGLFRAMFSTQTRVQFSKDESGCIFIDRSSKHFELILTFMRGGDVRLPDSLNELREIQKEAQFYLMADLVKLCDSKMQDGAMQIVLNVGGTVFQTTIGTLGRINGNLESIFNPEKSIKTDANGQVFIDRDPKHFRLILNFLRNGRIEFPDEKQELNEILQEARYYKLYELVKNCRRKIDYGGPNDRLESYFSHSSEEEKLWSRYETYRE